MRIKRVGGVAVEEAGVPLGGKDNTSRFNIIYANLPMNERVQIVVVIDDQPISWKMAHREINNKTKLGGRILRSLVKVGII